MKLARKQKNALIHRYGLNSSELQKFTDTIKEIRAWLDENLKLSIEYGNGIRILKQDIFETIISFIISANNNIPRIKLLI